jgi:hypothetical protein
VVLAQFVDIKERGLTIQIAWQKILVLFSFSETTGAEGKPYELVLVSNTTVTLP